MDSRLLSLQLRITGEFSSVRRSVLGARRSAHGGESTDRALLCRWTKPVPEAWIPLFHSLATLIALGRPSSTLAALSPSALYRRFDKLLDAPVNRWARCPKTIEQLLTSVRVGLSSRTQRWEDRFDELSATELARVWEELELKGADGEWELLRVCSIRAD